MLGGLLLIGGIGLVAGVVLAVAAKVFYVYTDPKIVAIEDALPGANCGGCGHPGCSRAAVAILKGESPPNVCVAGGTEVHRTIASLLGVVLKEREPQIAQPGCTYGVAKADLKYIYDGFNDCRAAVLLSGGTKACPIGCLGLGTCERACPFNAIYMGPDGLPIVDINLCTGCGTCERVCPKNIITLTSTTRRLISEYTVNECTAPCQRACPTGIDIPGFIREIRNENFDTALQIIREKCPLPLVCGYICPAPCELECRRTLVDEGVAINPLKRFVADYEMAKGSQTIAYKAPPNDLKIALIGGGAEGLTAAYYLARLGYQPTIFEAKDRLGGVLRYVISEDRLPRRVLEHDIECVLETGVLVQTKKTMGRDFTISTLLEEGFDSVLLTTGGLDSRKILHSHQNGNDWSVCGVSTIFDFYTALEKEQDMDLGNHIVIVGSDANTLELAQQCLELNARRVTVTSNKPLHSLPAEFHQTRALRARGIEVRHSTRVRAIEGFYENIHSVVLEDVDMPGSPWSPTVEANTLLFSAGRLPEFIFVHSSENREAGGRSGGWRTLEAFRTFPGGNGEGILTPPEPGRISDASAVVKAICSGRRLARAVNQHFTEGSITPVNNPVSGTMDVLNVREVNDVAQRERARPETQDVTGLGKSSWIFPKELPGLDETAATREAQRCLQCGLICYRREIH